VLGGQFADVSDAREPLDKYRCVEIDASDPLDFELVHAPSRGVGA